MCVRPPHAPQAVAVVQKPWRKADPAMKMEELGFGKLKLVESITGVAMSGSGKKMTAYVFMRA